MGSESTYQRHVCSNQLVREAKPKGLRVFHLRTRLLKHDVHHNEVMAIWLLEQNFPLNRPASIDLWVKRPSTFPLLVIQRFRLANSIPAEVEDFSYLEQSCNCQNLPATFLYNDLQYME